MLNSLSHSEKIALLTLEPHMIQYMEQDSSLVLISLIVDPSTIKFVESPTSSAQSLIITEYPHLIPEIKNRDEELLLNEVWKNPSIYKWIPSPSPDITKVYNQQSRYCTIN